MSTDTLPLEKRLNYNFPLEKFLSDDRAIACTKEMGKEIKKYLNSEKIKQLILLITKEPESDDILIGHKYPYVASEILKAECPFILERFILNKEEYYKTYKKIIDEQIKEKIQNTYIINNEENNKEKKETNENNENEKEISKINKDKEKNKSNIDFEINKVIKDKKNKYNINFENKEIDDFQKEEEKVLLDSDNYMKEFDRIFENQNNNEMFNILDTQEDKEEEMKEDNDKKELNIIEKIKDNQNQNQNEKELNKQIEINFIDNKKEDKQNEQNEINKNNKKEILNNEYIIEENEKKTINKNKNENKNENENENEIKQEKNELNQINEEEKKIIQNNESEIKNNNKNINNIKLYNNKYEDDHLESNIKDEVNSVSLSDDSEENDNEKSKNQNNTFLDLLLDFIMSNKPELNYVLSGYVSNTLLALIKTYPTKLLNYLYKNRKDALKKIIFRSQQRVFSVLASKLLNLEKYDDFMKSVIFFEKSVKYRNELIGYFVKSLSLEGYKDEYDKLHTDCNIESHMTFIMTLIDENINVVEYILEKNDIYGHILNILNINLYEGKKDDNFNNKYNNYLLLMKLINKLLKNTNLSEFFEYPKEFSLHCIKKKKSQLSFNDYMIICFTNILKNNFMPKKPTLLLEIRSKLAYKGLGILNLEIIELTKNMFTFMTKIPHIFDLILINNNFCQKSFDYFFEYQWNNIYHLQFVEFFDMYLKKEIEHKELTNFFFEKYKLHEVLINYLKPSDDNTKIYFKYKSGNKIKSGLYPHVINLMYKLQVISGLNTLKDEEQAKLNIINLGEFEFLKDENANKEIKINRINISWRIGTILKESNKWNEIIEKTIIPLIKKYEGKLGGGKIKKKEIEDINDIKEGFDSNNLVNIIDKNTKMKEKNRKKRRLKIDELCFMNKYDNTPNDIRNPIYKSHIEEEPKPFRRKSDVDLITKNKKKMDEFYKKNIRNEMKKERLFGQMHKYKPDFIDHFDNDMGLPTGLLRNQFNIKFEIEQKLSRKRREHYFDF